VRKTFAEKFGKSPGDMTDGEWRMAVTDMFSGVYDRLDITNGSIKEIPKIKSKISKIWIIGGVYGGGMLVILVWLIETFLAHCGI
jgi:hypothetical protein